MDTARGAVGREADFTDHPLIARTLDARERKTSRRNFGFFPAATIEGQDSDPSDGSLDAPPLKETPRG